MNDVDFIEFNSLLLSNNTVVLDEANLLGDFTINQINATINLRKCIVNERFNYISYSDTWLVLNFNETIFKKELIIEIGNSKLVQLTFENCKFNNGFKIQHKGNNIKLVCDNCTWSNEIDISECKFDFMKISNCSLINNKTKDIFSTNNFVATKIVTQGESYFNDSELGNSNFDGSIFNMHVKFDRSKFTTCNFINAEFKRDAYFNLVEFGEICTFNGARFNELFVAPSLNINSNNCTADFSGCLFLKQVYFDNSNFKSIIFKNTVFTDVASFNNTKFENIDFQRTLFEKFADFADTKYINGDRESFRLVKSELLKINNKVESLYYQSRELIQYEKSIKFWSSPFEKSMLFLNRISNDHGLNWAKGIWFTFYVSLSFYTVYLILLPCTPFVWGFKSLNSFFEASDVVVKNYFQFITLVRNFDFIKSSCPNSLSYIIDFVGRIFIGYGIYQTIQAFRKYGKQ